MKIYCNSLIAALLLAALPGVLEAQPYTWLGGQDVTSGYIGSNPASNIVTNLANWGSGSGTLSLNRSSIELVFGDSVQPFAYDATPYLNSAVNQIGQLTITRATNPVTISSSPNPNPTLFVANGTGALFSGQINGLNIANGITQNSDANVAVVGAINLDHTGSGNFTISGIGFGNVTLGQAPGSSGSGIISSNQQPVDISMTGHQIGGTGPMYYSEIQIAGDATNLGPVNLNSGFLAVTPSSTGFESNVVLGPGTQFTINTNATSTYPFYNGTISGQGQFVKNGIGIATLNGTNSYAGATIVAEGTLIVGADNALPSTVLSIHPDTTLRNGTIVPTILEVAGNQTVDHFSGSNNFGSIVLESGKTLTVDTNQYVPDTNGNPTTTPISSSYAGTISDVPVGGMGGSLVISGIKGSKTTLSGSNTYTGGTTVNGGELGIKNTSGSALGTGPVTVMGVFNSGTLVNPGIISGAGGFTGALALKAGAVIFPKGTLNVGGTTLYGGAVYSWALLNAGGDPGIGYGSLNINGGLNLSNLSPSNPFTIHPMSVTVDGSGTMNLGTATFDPTRSYSFTLASTTGITGFSASDFVFNWTSDFQNAYTGTWSVVQNGNLLQLQYVGAPIPEPADGAMLAGAFALAGALWRRKKTVRA